MAVTRTRRVCTVLAVLVLFAMLPAVATAQPSSGQPDPEQPSAGAPPSEGEDGQAGGGQEAARTSASRSHRRCRRATRCRWTPAGRTRRTSSRPQCVSSSGTSVELTTKPWGQDRLRFERPQPVRHRQGADGRGDRHRGVAAPVPRQAPRGRRRLRDRGRQGLKDCDGHGTEVAGIIAADPKDEGIGFRGVAPDARILSIRQSSANYKFEDQGDQQNSVDSAGNLDTLAQAIAGPRTAARR